MEKIAIASGKGGVGKTSITLIIANHLSNQGFQVGLLDADIYGPNLTQIILPDNSKYSITHDEELNKFIPLAIGNMLINSIDFVIDKQKAAIWRGPVLSKAIKQLYQGTNWGDLDYLLIDMPPGTGDAYLTILNDLDINDVVLVAVEDDFCIADLHKTNSLIKKFKKNCLGIIENMSENFDINDDPVLSKRIKDEFNLEILFTLPRIPRKDFYEELVNLDKLKKYIPKKMFK
jgi:ATP-binding protein involved in chromosome partitioning